MTKPAPDNLHIVKAVSLFLIGMITMLCAFLPLDLHAHDSPAKREVIVQLSGDEVSILLDYEMPAGEDVERLMVRHDLDHDGIISDLETPRLAARLIPSAFAGLNFEVIDERPATQEPQVKIKRTEEGRLAMAVLLTYKLDPIATKRRLRVTLHDDPHTIDTPIIIQTTESLTITAVDTQKLDTARDKILHTLTRGASFVVSVTPTVTPKQ